VDGKPVARERRTGADQARLNALVRRARVLQRFARSFNAFPDDPFWSDLFRKIIMSRTFDDGAGNIMRSRPGVIDAVARERVLRRDVADRAAKQAQVPEIEIPEVEIIKPPEILHPIKPRGLTVYVDMEDFLRVLIDPTKNLITVDDWQVNVADHLMVSTNYDEEYGEMGWESYLEVGDDATVTLLYTVNESDNLKVSDAATVALFYKVNVSDELLIDADPGYDTPWAVRVADELKVASWRIVKKYIAVDEADHLKVSDDSTVDKRLWVSESDEVKVAAWRIVQKYIAVNEEDHVKVSGLGGASLVRYVDAEDHLKVSDDRAIQRYIPVNVSDGLRAAAWYIVFDNAPWDVDVSDEVKVDAWYKMYTKHPHDVDVSDEVKVSTEDENDEDDLLNPNIRLQPLVNVSDALRVGTEPPFGEENPIIELPEIGIPTEWVWTFDSDYDGWLDAESGSDEYVYSFNWVPGGGSDGGGVSFYSIEGFLGATEYGIMYQRVTVKPSTTYELEWDGKKDLSPALRLAWWIGPSADYPDDPPLDPQPDWQFSIFMPAYSTSWETHSPIDRPAVPYPYTTGPSETEIIVCIGCLTQSATSNACRIDNVRLFES